MTAPSVLFAYERLSVAMAVRRVLELYGFTVDIVRDGNAAMEALSQGRWDALVVDVALPGMASYDLAVRAKEMAAGGADRGAGVVVLVSSVYRKTSYKRRPTRLYGADDYVEIHHLGDLLPQKLSRLLDYAGTAPVAPVRNDAEDRVAAVLLAQADMRMSLHDRQGLACLIVADVILYNGDRILPAGDLHAAEEAVSEDLALARQLFDQVARAEGRDLHGGDPIGDAFKSLMSALGRPEVRA